MSFFDDAFVDRAPADDGGYPERGARPPNLAELTADLPAVRGELDGTFRSVAQNGSPAGFDAARPSRFAQAGEPEPPPPPPQNGFGGGGFDSARPTRFAPPSESAPLPPPPRNGFVGGGFESARPNRFAPAGHAEPPPRPNGFGPAPKHGFDEPRINHVGPPPADDFGPATQVGFATPPADDFGPATQNGFGTAGDDGFGPPTVHDYAAPTIHDYAVHDYAAPADDGFGAPTVHDFGVPTVHDYAAPADDGFGAPTVHDFGAVTRHDLGAVAVPGLETSTQQIPSVRFVDDDDMFGSYGSRGAEPADELGGRHSRRLPERPEPASKPTSRRPGRTLRRVATTAAAFTLALVVSSASVAGLAYQKYNRQLNRVSVLQRHDPSIREAARQQNAENFLMIGSDSRSGANSTFGNVAGARSDTTILVHLSPDHTKATIISIPRDSWVDIPPCKQGDGSMYPEHSDMFNSAFSIGGPACTIATVQKLTGIAITHFVEIDFSGFQKMVDALGSVRICSPQTVYDPMSGLRLHAGVNALGGSQALAYVRARESLGDGSDLGRIKRQQIFLGAVLRQAMNGKLLSNPNRLTKFLDAATKSITVDKGTSFQDLRMLATSMQGLDPRRVTFYTAPIANANYTPPGTTMTGRVLLDSVAGRVLYDSVINDRKPVWVRKVNGKTRVVASPSAKSSGTSAGTSAGTSTSRAAAAPRSTTSTSSGGPQANGNAAQRTCSL